MSVQPRDERSGRYMPWPECWCGCGEPGTEIEHDSGEPAAEGCTEYACDDDGQPVCGCDPRVHDEGEWTGGGMHGTGTGWVTRMVFRDEAEVAQ